MTSRLLFAPEAEGDVDAIEDYIAKDNPAAAERFSLKLEETCRMLADNPLIGRSRENLAPNLRSFPSGRYVIFYRPLPDGVEIARVIGAQDPSGIFGDVLS